MKKILFPFLSAVLICLLSTIALTEPPASVLVGKHATVMTDGTYALGSVNLITQNAGPINFSIDNKLVEQITGTGIFSLYPRGDVNRKFTFDASSDTAHSITFGDGGTTATQTLTISGSTSNGDDDGALTLAGGGASGAERGSYLTLYGNEQTNNGSAYLTSGDNASGNIYLRGAGSGSGVYINTGGNVARWTFESNGDFTQNAATGGNLIMSAANTYPIFGATGISTDVYQKSGVPGLYIEKADAQYVIAAEYGVNAATPPIIALFKSRGTDGEANTIVQAGDNLGKLRFYGADGVEFEEGGSIVAAVDGTPGENDMPTRLEFAVTPDGASSSVITWYMKANGDLLQAAGGGMVKFNRTGYGVGMDNIAKTLLLAGGTTDSTSSGATVKLSGNDLGGTGLGGNAVISAGNTATGTIKFRTGAGLEVWDIQPDGDLAQNATNGGNIVFGKDLTGIIDSTDAPAAAGDALANATALTANVTFVTDADATKGVKFPAAPVGGTRYVIYNTANAVLKVWPGEAGDNINANADGANVAVAAYGTLYCHASSADQLWCGELANP